MPKRKSDRNFKEEKWRRKIKKYEEKLGRKYNQDELPNDPTVSPSQIVFASDIAESPMIDIVEPEVQPVASPPPLYLSNAVSEQSLPALTTGANIDTVPACNEPEQIDLELLQALGEFIPEASEWAEDINENLAKRWDPILKEGLKKEVRDETLKKYLLPKNCSLSKPPILNPEIAAVLSESVKNRDFRILKKQGQLGCALSVIGKVLTGMLKKSIETPEALSLLCDASKLIADSHYAETETRRALVTPLLEKSFIEPFKDRKRDSHLFGDNLGEFIRSSRGIKKTGQLLQANSSSNSNLNWKDPPPRQLQRSSRGTASRGGGPRTLPSAIAAVRHRPPPPPAATRRAPPTTPTQPRRSYAPQARRH